MLLIIDQNLFAPIVAPVITLQPQSQTLAAGATASFSVTATGLSLNYQWYRNGVPISGATSSTLSYGPVAFPGDDGSQFTVTVSNSAGLTTSGIAVLTVILATAQIAPLSTTAAQDIIIGSLLNINAYAPGQSLQSSTAEVGLNALNDLIDSLNNDQAFIYTQSENIVQWTPGKYKYSVGNPLGGNFSGTVVGNSNVITNVTVPANLVKGGTLTDLYGSIPAGTTITAIGTNQLTMSAPAKFTVGAPEPITYTTPGDFGFQRPLRIRTGYTRITSSSAGGLDYWFDCQNSLDRYNEIGLKSVPGPWPYLLAYQPTFPLGTIWIYPNPQIGGEVHLFTDLILSGFPLLNSAFALPQGYKRALIKLLALELCPIFGKTPSPQLILQAKEAKQLLQDQNSSPVTTLRYDADLVYSRHTDASWIMTGGFV